jgi:hypothetical protein
MLTQSQHLRVLLAAGDLQARGLLVPESDPERAALRIEGRGFRYHPRFWTLTGVLEVEGLKCHLRLKGTDAERARRRIAREWIMAGAPNEWARREAEGVVMLLLVRPDIGASA